ncbi:MFS transporter [Haloprofundus salinisoli]|uniref:MFS transporter n=1 Tax=Haloprofundus salinisoli TaxID=2876193 RepID=UPI001CCCCDDE|nr:MFS transporter [Haloprofundus salinisoli]
MKARTVIRQEAKSLWGEGKGPILTTIAIGWGLIIGVRMIMPVIIPHLQTGYGLSLSVSGLLMTVLFVFYSVGQLPGGMLTDRYNESTLMVASLLVTAAAIGLFTVAPTAIALFLATVVWGLGSSLFPVARITYLSELYPERLGSASGITLAASDIGQTVLPPIGVILAAAFAWQLGLGFAIPLLLLASISLLIFSNQSKTNRAGSTLSIREMVMVLEELRKPAIGTVVAVFFLYYFTWQAFTSFYPTYLITNKELSSPVASVVFGFFFATGVVVKPLSGTAYDRIGIRRSLLSILIPAAGGFLLLPFIQNVWLIVGVTALVSMMLGSGAITQSYLANSLPEEMQGVGLGVIQTVTSTLASGGPILFGVIADHGFLDEGYLALAVIMAVTVLFIARMPRI